jgi:predicted nucleic acid-binding protein
MRALRTRFEGRILPVDDDILDRWGRITGTAAAAGTPIPGIDAIFAATALHHGLTLVTRNDRHIQAAGVALLNPWR